MLIDIESFENFRKEKEQLQSANSFTNNYDHQKVVDVSSMGLIKKRPRPEDTLEDTQTDQMGGKKNKSPNK